MQLTATLPARLRQRFGWSAAPSSTAYCRRAVLLAAHRRRAATRCAADAGPHHVLRAAVVRGCGVPFPHPMGDGAVCADCAREQASWDRARAVLRYDKHSRRLVLGVEAWRPHPSRRRVRAAGCTAPGARSSAGRSADPGAAALDPAFRAATTRRRCWPRRSAPPAGRRSRPTGWCAAAARPRKAGSGRRRARATCAAPLRCAAGAACAASGWSSSTTCMTTGATVEECARVLRRAGAASVGVLTWRGRCGSAAKRAGRSGAHIGQLKCRNRRSMRRDGRGRDLHDDVLPLLPRARALLDHKGVAYTEIDIDRGTGKRDEMIQRAGGRTRCRRSSSTASISAAATTWSRSTAPASSTLSSGVGA